MLIVKHYKQTTPKLFSCVPKFLIEVLNIFICIVLHFCQILSVHIIVNTHNIYQIIEIDKIFFIILIESN